MQNITTNHAITYTNTSGGRDRVISAVFSGWYRLLLLLSPRTAGSQAFSVNAFLLRIREMHRPRGIMGPGARRGELICGTVTPNVRVFSG